MNSTKFVFARAVFSILLLAVPSLGFAQAADELFSFAQSLKQDHLYEAAGQQFLKFAMENADDERASMALENAADCLARTGSLGEAVKVLETLINSYPDDPHRCRFQVRRGKLLHKMKRFEDAARVFSDVITGSPGCPLLAEAVLGRGEALLATAKYEEARAVLTELVKTYKDQKVAPNAYYALASAAEGMGDRRAALESFTLLASTYPRHPLSGFASLEAGRIHAEDGDSLAALSSFAGAREFKEKAIFEPASVEGARLLEKMGRFDKALEWYNALITRGGIDEESAFFEGAARASFYAGNFAETESIAARFEKNNKKSFSPEVTYYRTRAQLATEKFEEALAGADLLDRMAPGSEKGKYAPRLKGEALAALKRPREALSEFRRFASTAADSSAKVEALSRLADIYAADLADTTRALEVLMEKLDVEKRRVASDCIAVAAMYELVHDYKRARGLYEYVAKVFPFGAAADLAEKRLKYIDAFAVIDEADALKRMEKAARDIISLPQSEGMLHLAAARMEILKDFEGALSLIDQVLKSTGKSSVEAKGLYYKGACYALKAGKSTASGDSSASASALKSARTAWGELVSRFQKSSWAARAAYEKILARFAVTGKVDTIEVFNTLASYPTRSERARAFEVLGDYYERLGGRGSMSRRVGYYRKALLVPDGLEEPASIRLRLADALMKTGDYEGSLEVSKSVRSEQKKLWHLRAAYLSASALRQMKKFAEAGRLFMEVSQGDPYGEMGARALLQAADCLYSRRRFDEAAQTYTAALDKAPSSKLAWEITYRLSLCWDKMGETRDALDLLESCLNSKSGGKMRNRAYERAIKMAEALGDRDKERYYLERFVREFNKTPRARAAQEKLIRWYLANGLAAEALELSSDLSEGGTDEERNRAEAVRIMALFRAGRIGEARDLEEKLRRRKIAPPLLWEMHLQAAWYYYGRRDYKSSLASSKILVDECPKGAPCEEAVFIKTMSLFGLKQIEQAASSANTFLAKYPLGRFASKVHLKYGNALAGRSQFSEAVLHYSEAAASSGDSSIVFEALKNEAVAYQKLTKWREAGKAWSQIIDKFPSSSYTGEASLNIARCKMENGDLTESIKAYGEALPHLDDQGKARAYFWSGECYQKLNDFKAAVTEYLKVPYLVPKEALWGVTAQLKAAECYISIERFESAKKLYEKVIRQYGLNSNWGQAAAKGLEQLRGLEGADGKPKGNG